MSLLKRVSQIFDRTEKKKKVELPSKEKSFSEDFLREIIPSIEEKEVAPWLTDIFQKKILEVAPRQRPLTVFREKGARMVTRLGSHKELEIHSPTPSSFVLSHWETFPFLPETWEVVFLRMTFLKMPLGRVLREAHRILKKDGSVFLTDLHPFSAWIQKDHLKSVAGEETAGPGLERYFKWFQEAGFRVTRVKETFFDGSVRKLVTSEEQKKGVESLRRTPFLILFQLKKES